MIKKWVSRLAINQGEKMDAIAHRHWLKDGAGCLKCSAKEGAACFVRSQSGTQRRGQDNPLLCVTYEVNRNKVLVIKR